MHGREKSDPAIVARKSANVAGRPAAEPVERRAGAEGNADQRRTRRAQDRASVSQALGRVRRAARQRKKERFTALLHHLSQDLLRVAFFALKRDAASGVDGLTWRTTRQSSSQGSRTRTLGSTGERTGRSRPGDGTYPSRTAASARSRSPPWRTRSSRRRRWRC